MTRWPAHPLPRNSGGQGSTLAICAPFTLSKVLRFGALLVALVVFPRSVNGQTPGTGTVTIAPRIGCCEVGNAGPFLILTVNGAQTQVTQIGDLLGAAQALTNAINSSNPFVTASISGNIITLTARATGSATNYPFSAVWVFPPNPALPFDTSGPTLTGGTNAVPIPGFINPKYLIVGVTYAPPGSQSFVQYTDSVLVGNMTTINKSFTDQNMLSVTVGTNAGFDAFGPMGKIAGTETVAYSQMSSTANTVNISKSTQESDKTPGPSNSFIGINHDFDVIWLWLNPVMPLTFFANDPNAVGWGGYGYDPNDQLGLDIFPVYVGWLNGDIPIPSNVATVLARNWASGYMWGSGQGPGLTGPGPDTDFATIVQADPFWQCNQVAASCPATPDLTRFTLSDNQNIVYEQAPVGGQPITQTYQLQYTNTSTQGKATQTTFSEGFALEVAFSGSGFFAKVLTDFKISNMLTWTTMVNSSVTNTTMSSAQASISGPTCTVSSGSNSCSPQYTGPVEFEIYQDNQYGTFMFLPVNGSSGMPLSMAGSASLPDGVSDLPYGPAMLTATGGSGTGYTWCVQSGSVCVQSGPPLPAGFALTPQGTCGNDCTHVLLSSTGMPGALAGHYSFTVQVMDSRGSVATQLVTLNIQGPVVAFSAAGLTFNARLAHTTSSPQAVTVTNSGNLMLNVKGISITGDFSQTNTCGAPIALGATCSISVAFVPTAIGQRTGELSISDNAGGTPQIIPLSGSGTDFTLNVANAGSTSAAVTAGQPATYNLEVNPLGGFSGSVGLACTGATTLATCTVSPQTVGVGDGSPTAFTVRVDTTPLAATASRPFGISHPSAAVWFGLTVFVLSLFGVKRIDGRTTLRLKPRWGAAGVLFFLVITLSSCTASAGAGTYTLTVTGSQQGVNRTLNLILTVNYTKH